MDNTLLLITVDMSRPWNALDSLQKWAAVAREHVDKLRVAPEKLRELEHKSESYRQPSGLLVGRTVTELLKNIIQLSKSRPSRYSCFNV